MSALPLLEVQNVSKKYCRSLRRSLVYGCRDILNEITFSSRHDNTLRKDEFWSLDNVNLQVNRGEIFAILGRNGAGKTTLLKLINGLIKPDRGQITVRGKIGALMALGAGFNPVLSGRENIYINAAILGFSRKATDAGFSAIVDFSELGEFIDTPVRNYSSGMKARLGFAIAAQIKPDILLLDEVLSVGDVSFRRKCLKKLEEIKKEVAVLFVSHNLRLVEDLCDKAVYLEKGTIKYSGDVDYVNGKYLEDINRESGNSDDSARREGTGEIRYSRVRVYGSKSGDNRLLHTGDTLNIEADYKVLKPVNRARFRVGIEDNKSGVMLTAANTEIEITANQGKLVCSFPDLCLRPGNYSVILGVTDKKFAFDVWKYAAEIIVTGTRNEDVQFAISDSDLIYLPHEMGIHQQNSSNE